MSSDRPSMYKQSFHMPKEVTDECRAILLKYLKYKRVDLKRKTRDAAYFKMKSYLAAWINSMLKKWRKFEQPDEILSLSWLAFMFCLNNYKEEYTNVDRYFYEYTRYFLLNNYAKKENVSISLDELKEILDVFPTTENMVFERLLTLYQFRNAVSEKCVSVWDDAIQCLEKEGGCKRNNKPKYFSNPAYYSVRESFSNIIRLVLDMPAKEGKNKVC